MANHAHICVMGPKNYNVFVSHAREDTDVAMLLPRHIRSAGVDCSIDDEFLEYGDKFQSRILERVQSSDELLILFSPIFREKKNWMFLELGMALGVNLTIIPILFRTTVTDLSPVDYLNNCVPLPLLELPHYLDQLKNRAKRRTDSISQLHYQQPISELSVRDQRERLIEAFVKSLRRGA